MLASADSSGAVRLGFEAQAFVKLRRPLGSQDSHRAVRVSVIHNASGTEPVSNASQISTMPSGRKSSPRTDNIAANIKAVNRYVSAEIDASADELAAQIKAAESDR